MRPLSLPGTIAAMLLSVALPSVWVAGAHLHLCFDGLEPPVTLHALVDAGAHAGHHAPDEQHSDSDVGTEASLTRAPQNGAQALAVAPVAAHALTTARSVALPRDVSAPIGDRVSPWSLQPPLRAPPA
ncbi:MAG: hypothetical protein JRG76_14335 [Deltaproteobacteria bacterium]|nr:hypothetical protein [Deltaproteobacteria bacterium]MBW2415680.1 hypothetical protein [Deltaproteobacteria bacterium]